MPLGTPSENGSFEQLQWFKKAQHNKIHRGWTLNPGIGITVDNPSVRQIELITRRGIPRAAPIAVAIAAVPDTENLQICCCYRGLGGRLARIGLTSAQIRPMYKNYKWGVASNWASRK
jgi:hypothetical protein